jgi:serine/threonine-protein kinase
MLRLLIDQDLDQDILRGLLRRLPGLDAVTAYEAGLSESPDSELLAWAAEKGRIIITHDRQSMPGHVAERIRDGERIAGSDHAPIVIENANLFGSIALASGAGLTCWSGYMALEPLIRRRSPETVITWSRLLMGQFRDPLLARDILIGVLAACAYLIVVDLVWWASALDGIGAIHDSLLGTRQVLGIVMNKLSDSVLWPVVLLMLFFLFRAVLRKPWLAAAAVILIFTFAAGSPFIADVFTWGLWWSVYMFLLLRFGLVAGCAMHFSSGLLAFVPLTANFTAWYASSGMFAVGVVLLLAGCAFYTSLGGQKVYQGSLLED